METEAIRKNDSRNMWRLVIHYFLLYWRSTVWRDNNPSKDGDTEMMQLSVDDKRALWSDPSLSLTALIIP